jgi:hypothetical protein
MSLDREMLAPYLQADEPSQRKHEAHGHDEIRIECILEAIYIAHLHMVPEDIIRLGSSGYSGLLFLIENQEIRCPLILP